MTDEAQNRSFGPADVELAKRMLVGSLKDGVSIVAAVVASDRTVRIVIAGPGDCILLSGVELLVQLERALDSAAAGSDAGTPRH